MNALLSAAVIDLADGGDSPSNVDPTTGHGPEWGAAAPIGLLIIVLLCIALYFLVKSMNRNLKKVPESFDLVPAAVGVGKDQMGESDRSTTAPVAGEPTTDAEAGPPGFTP